jgi:hypothetical protein
VVDVAGRGAEEEEGSTGVPVSGSPGLRRRRSGGTTMMKAVVEEHSARACSRRGERGRGGGGAVSRGGAGAPFYRVGGGAGYRGAITPAVLALHEGKIDEGEGKWQG